MSWKSCVTATFATMLVAAVLGCDDDPSSPSPDPESISGTYDYTFVVSNGGEGEVACDGQGMITISQLSDSTFSAETAADGTVGCIVFGVEIPDEESGVVDLDGQIDGNEVMFQFPLLEESELCQASGEIQGDPVTGISGTATCVLDPAAFGLEGDPIELTGPWQADRQDG